MFQTSVSICCPVVERSLLYLKLIEKMHPIEDKVKELTKLKATSQNNVIAPTATKRLEMMIKSVEGIRDQMSIYQFIQNLPIKDSQDFRKYVSENKPGLDLILDITAPSGEKVQTLVDFGVEFFRPFFGL